MTLATVDAALALIAGQVNANGDEEALTLTVDSGATSPRQMRSVKVAERRKGHTTKAFLRYPNGPLTSRVASGSIKAAVRKYRPQ